MILELAKTGTWSGKKLTKSMLRDVADSFSDPKPVILGHEGAWFSDAMPAVGWVENLELKANTLQGKITLNAEGQALWEAKKFRTWSIGIAQFEENGPLELAHLALLGATNPAVKGLKVLEFSEGQPKQRMTFINFSQEQQPEDTVMDIDKIKTEMTADFDAKIAKQTESFNAELAKKETEINALRAVADAAKKAEFNARVESIFSAGEGKVPAEKLKNFKALFSAEEIKIEAILAGISDMFSGMPAMVSLGQNAPANSTNGIELPTLTKGV